MRYHSTVHFIRYSDLCTLTFDPYRELSGVIVSLDELGHLVCNYLGTDPSVFSAFSSASRELNYEVWITRTIPLSRCRITPVVSILIVARICGVGVGIRYTLGAQILAFLRSARNRSSLPEIWDPWTHPRYYYGQHTQYCVKLLRCGIHHVEVVMPCCLLLCAGVGQGIEGSPAHHS